MSADMLAAALDYIARGMAPIPVPFRKKGPVFDDWQSLRISARPRPDISTASQKTSASSSAKLPAVWSTSISTVSSGPAPRPPPPAPHRSLRSREQTRVPLCLSGRTSPRRRTAARKNSSVPTRSGCSSSAWEPADGARRPFFRRACTSLESRSSGRAEGPARLPRSTARSCSSTRAAWRRLPSSHATIPRSEPVTTARISSAVSGGAAAFRRPRRPCSSKRSPPPRCSRSTSGAIWRGRPRDGAEAGKRAGFPLLAETFGKEPAKKVAAWLDYRGGVDSDGRPPGGDEAPPPNDAAPPIGDLVVEPEAANEISARSRRSSPSSVLSPDAVDKLMREGSLYTFHRPHWRRKDRVPGDPRPRPRPRPWRADRPESEERPGGVLYRGKPRRPAHASDDCLLRPQHRPRCHRPRHRDLRQPGDP